MSDGQGESRAMPFDDRAFRHLAEFAPDALIAHGGGKVLWANAAAARLMGLSSADELVGRSVMGFIAPESAAVVKARVERMLASGKSEPSEEETFIGADGERIPLEVSASPIGDGVLLAAAHDLRPRRQAERERRTAEARARAFFDATTAAMGISRRGLHVEVNAAYARLFGYPSPEALVGVPILDLLDPSEHPRILENVRLRARGEQAPSIYSVRGRRRDGTSLVLELHASSYAEGDADTTVVVMRDITAQREFEARLADSERRHRELLQQVPVGVWEEDLSGVKRFLDGLRARGVVDVPRHFREHPEDLTWRTSEVKILSVNAAACEMVGAKDQAELIAHLPQIFIPEAQLDIIVELAQLAAGKRVASTEGWVGTLGGERHWVAARATVAEGHDDWSRVLVTTSDMTERQKAREDKAALLEQLRHAEKLEAIGRLAGGVAHDFNNLLAVILSSAEVSLDEAPPGSRLHESLGLIQEASTRARDLVQQILTFGRKDQPKREPLDLSEVVTGALGLVRAAIPSSVQLEVEVPPGVGTVLADRTQVHQVVMNLCTNARDAVGPTGHIAVSLERVTRPGQAPQAKLRVKDDGAGVDEAIRARIFEPNLTPNANGHGLGLAVVHGIVEAAGGHIQFESARGRGASFEVSLPLVEAVPPQPASVTVVEGGRQRVLLVEDQPMVRTALGRMLASLGYQVTEAADGQEALERLRAGHGGFDIVVSDQTMPRLSGLELARAMQTELPGTPILLCTGFSDVLDAGAAKELGVAGVLSKPLSREEMAAALRRALTTPRD